MSGAGKALHVCFYSNSCRWSKAFLEALKGTPFITEFQFICVDGKVKELTQRYSFLKKTPTLIIKGEDEPRTDGNVMNWLSERKLLSRPTSEGGQQASTEPEPWVSGEMGGSLTKGFSFLGANDSNDAPMGNFEFLNGQQAVGTKTASDMPGGGLGARGQQKSRKEELFDKQYESYLRSRDQGMNMPPMRQ
jgi:hypothetical protein